MMLLEATPDRSRRYRPPYRMRSCENARTRCYSKLKMPKQKRAGSKEDWRAVGRLVTGLGATFKKKMLSDDSERRVFSFAFQSRPNETLLKLLNLAIGEGYLVRGFISKKEGIGRRYLYVLTRRVAPAFSLDVSAYSGYLSVEPHVVEKLSVTDEVADLYVGDSKQGELFVTGRWAGPRLGACRTRWEGGVVMIGNFGQAAMIAATSFEDRSLVSVKWFLSSGGRTEAVFLANIVEPGPRYEQQVSEFKNLGIGSVKEVDRFSSRSLWSWCLSVVAQAAQTKPSLVIDITCMPRELLGMLLFAVRMHQEHFPRVFVAYVAAPPKGYATQNPNLAEKDKWLSRGVETVRTIVGYPGTFRADRPTHLIALAGHEFQRLFAIAEYVEPSRLTIGGEQEGSSTVSGAGVLSQEVAQSLRDRIQVPDIRDISFSASSITEFLFGAVELEYGRGKRRARGDEHKAGIRRGGVVFSSQPGRTDGLCCTEGIQPPLLCWGWGRVLFRHYDHAEGGIGLAAACSGGVNRGRC